MVLQHVGHSHSHSHHGASTSTNDLPSYLTSNPNVIPFLFSFTASMGTFLGGILTILIVKVLPSSSNNHAVYTNNLLGILQSFSAGVMLYMTFIDLMPEARESLGSYESSLWFFAGVIAFGLLEGLLVPSTESKDSTGHYHSLIGDVDNHKHTHNDGISNQYIANEQIKSPSTTRKRRGSPSSKPVSSELESDAFVTTTSSNNTSRTSKKALLRTSLVTFIAMGLHNLPEGISVYLGTLTDLRLGLQLAAAICLVRPIDFYPLCFSYFFTN